MKILFIAPSFPVNNGSGSAHRTYQLYEQLKQVADVDFCTCNLRAVDAQKYAKNFSEKNCYLGNVTLPLRWPWFFKKVGSDHQPLAKLLVKNYDVIFVRYYGNAYWLNLLGHEKLIVDCDDCYLEMFHQLKKNAHFFQWVVLSLRIFLLRKHYARYFPFMKKVIFAKLSPHMPWQDNFLIVPNKIAFTVAPPEPTQATDSVFRILFVGVLNYMPNRLGVADFIQHTWPLVKQLLPHAEFKIVGAGLPNHLIKEWSIIPGIKICGFIEDIKDVYSDVHISISPIHHGSGTHIKIMESLMRGKTMVISQLSHRGYEETLKDKECLLIAENHQDFAEKISLLAKNNELRWQLEKNGFESVKKYHSITHEFPSELQQTLIDIIHK